MYQLIAELCNYVTVAIGKHGIPINGAMQLALGYVELLPDKMVK